MLEQVYHAVSVKHVAAAEFRACLSPKLACVADTAQLVSILATFIVKGSARRLDAGQASLFTLDSVAHVTTLLNFETYRYAFVLFYLCLYFD